MAEKIAAPQAAKTHQSVSASIPRLRYDGTICIAVGTSLYDQKWRSGCVTVSHLYARLARVTRTEHKGADGGYVFGRLSGSRRVTENVMGRSGIVLDYDHCLDVDALWDAVVSLERSAALYTTHRHTPDSPRCRVVIPARCTMTPEESDRVSRAVAQRLGIDGLDASTHEPVRMMFWPTAPEGSEFIYRYHDAPWLDPDEFMSEYPTRHSRDSTLCMHSTGDADERMAALRNIALGVSAGSRNQAAARLAGYLLSRLPDPDIAVALIEAWNVTCDPPMELGELHAVIHSIARRQATRERARHGA